MDQEPASEALSSVTTKKLNAQAPEFIPSTSSAAVMQHVYPTPPVRFPPPPYFGYERYFQQNPMPFYGYNVNNLSPMEVTADRSSGSGSASTVAASTKNGLPDAHVKIVNQVEFYFSDINLATTDQLFKLMIKDPEGYVPLSVVASFKKIKAAINSSTQLASILRSSKKLLVNEDGKKVKRQDPLTESDMEELQSRIVIAENLPEDHSHQNLMKVFSSVGSVKSIRACPPQKSNGGVSSASKLGKGDQMHFSSKFHAFVEYESVELAEKAVVELTDEGNWRNGLKVRLLLHSVVKPAQTRAKKVSHEVQPITRNDEALVPEMQHLKGNQLENSLPQFDSVFYDRQSSEDNGHHSNNIQKKGRNYGGGGGGGGGGGKGKGKGQGQGQGRGRALYPNNGVILGSPSTAETSGSMEKLTNVSKTPAVPRMPDGTRGFTMGRGKLLDIKIS